MTMASTEPVEIVRCGKCRYWEKKGKGILGEEIGTCCNTGFDFPFGCEYEPITGENDFCCWGKGKEADNQ